MSEQTSESDVLEAPVENIDNSPQIDLASKVSKSLDKMSTEELLEEVEMLVPPQYKGMSPDALLVVLDPKDVPRGLDGNPDQEELKRRGRLTAIIEDFLPEAQKKEEFVKKIRIDRYNKLRQIRSELNQGTTESIEQEKPNSLLSKELPEGQTNRVELLSGAVVAIHDNDAHGQDAVAIKDDVISISDGASSYGKSGAVSQEMSAKLVEQMSEGKSIDEALDGANITKILEDISHSSNFKNVDTSLNPHAKAENKDSGLATLVLTKINRENKTIEWGSVGDSPIIVLDKKQDGSWGFEFVNDDADGIVVTNENFTDPKVIADLKNPETQLVGIRGNGMIDTRSLSKIKKGTIEYKPGRVVVVASDFLTKMMLCSPEVIESMAKNSEESGKTKLAKALRSANQKTLDQGNPLAGNKFRPELFFNGELSAQELTKSLEAWKKMPANNSGVDDMTAVCIKMDEVFKE